ncbi:hypothetical protein M9Y10_019575 [Tritrichomonas musculus]|uniref:Protein kinase domain-containing protein n=1 Tax=Tritrichomonas musculus TaxID=1915356 RepID=A0ABR2HGT7_9EUKA
MESEDEQDNRKQYDLTIIRETLSQNGYSFLRPIGQGGFSSVFLVFSNQYNIEFVVKVSDYKGSQKSQESNEFDLNEINNLINLNHPNIINIYKYFTDEHYLYIVLEYCEGGSLKDMINKSGKIRSEILFTYCHQILTALKHCHDLKITHNDIKPANVLIDKNHRLKLADFGLAKGISQVNGQFKGQNGEIAAKQFGGSRPYMAPELFTSNAYDPFKGDIWSLGVTFYELATGHTPWKTSDLEQMRLQISVGVFSFQNQQLPPTFCKIIHRMLEVVPSKRPTIDWLLDQPIFNPESNRIPSLGKPLSNCSFSSAFNMSSSRLRISAERQVRSLQKMERKFSLNTVEKVDFSKNNDLLSDAENQNSQPNNEINRNFHTIRSCSRLQGSVLDPNNESQEAAAGSHNEWQEIPLSADHIENRRVSIDLAVSARNKELHLSKKMRSSLPLPKTFV